MIDPTIGRVIGPVIGPVRVRAVSEKCPSRRAPSVVGTSTVDTQSPKESAMSHGKHVGNGGTHSDPSAQLRLDGLANY
jgi:hypothetical protein